jgi:hypothetical protein
MKTILKVAILPALLLALASAAFADSITIKSSGCSASPCTNGALQYLGYTPGTFSLPYNTPLVAGTIPSGSAASYDVDSNGVWANAIAGSSWVSNSSDAGPSGSGNPDDGKVVDPNGFYYYDTTFTAVGGTEKYNGSISVMADDTAEVILNAGTADQVVLVPFGIVGSDSHCGTGSSLNGADPLPSCGGADTVSLSDITLLAGTNTLTIINAQTGLAGAGVDFTAELTQTPEPTSLLLLGTGLLGLAGMLRRKLRA